MTCGQNGGGGSSGSGSGGSTSSAPSEASAPSQEAPAPFPTHLRVMGDSDSVAGECKAYILQTVDVNNNSLGVLQNTEVSLEGEVFFEDLNCLIPFSSKTITLKKGEHTARFFIKPTLAQSMMIRASVAGLGEANMVTNVKPAFLSQLLISGSSAIHAESCNPYEVSAKDQFGNNIMFQASDVLNISGKGQGEIFLDSNCSSLVSDITNTKEQNKIIFFLKDSSEENITLTISLNNISSNFPITVKVDKPAETQPPPESPSSLNQLLVSGVSTIVAGSCNAYEVSAKDEKGNIFPFQPNSVLKILGKGQGEIFLDSNCTSSVVSDIAITKVQEKIIFFFKSTVVENVTVSASIDNVTSTIPITVQADKPASFSISGIKKTFFINECVEFTALIKDKFENLTQFSQETPIDFSGGKGSFFSNKECSTSASGFRMTSSKNFYFSDATVENITLDISSDILSASLAVSIVNKMREASVSIFPPGIFGITPSETEQNTSVEMILKGIRFFNGVRVMLGKTACSALAHVSENELRCIVPVSATAGPVDVVVTNSNGLSHVLKNGFTYLTKEESVQREANAGTTLVSGSNVWLLSDTNYPLKVKPLHHFNQYHFRVLGPIPDKTEIISVFSSLNPSQDVKNDPRFSNLKEGVYLVEVFATHDRDATLRSVTNTSTLMIQAAKPLFESGGFKLHNVRFDPISSALKFCIQYSGILLDNSQRIYKNSKQIVGTNLSSSGTVSNNPIIRNLSNNQDCNFTFQLPFNFMTPEQVSEIYQKGEIAYRFVFEIASSQDSPFTKVIDAQGTTPLHIYRDNHVYKFGVVQVISPGFDLNSVLVSSLENKSAQELLLSDNMFTSIENVNLAIIGADSGPRPTTVKVYSLKAVGKYWEELLKKHGIVDKKTLLGKNPKFEMIFLPFIEKEGLLNVMNKKDTGLFFEKIVADNHIDLTPYDFIGYIKHSSEAFTTDGIVGTGSHERDFFMQISYKNLLTIGSNSIFKTFTHEMGHQLFGLSDLYASGANIQYPIGVPDPDRSIIHQMKACLMAGAMFGFKSPSDTTKIGIWSNAMDEPSNLPDRFYVSDPQNYILCADDIFRILKLQENPNCRISDFHNNLCTGPNSAPCTSENYLNCSKR